MENVIAIVGLGGGGGWVSQLLAKSDRHQDKIILIDGDKVEKKNLDRQLFNRRDVGKYKADCFAASVVSHLNPKVYQEYIHLNSESYKELKEHRGDLSIFCCVDNHPARRCLLQLADERMLQDGAGQTYVFIAGNEFESSEAQVYTPTWMGSALDPRERYPEIKTDNDNDPRQPSCSGELAESNPQLALSNLQSAVNVLWLHRFWTEKIMEYDLDAYPELFKTYPVIHSTTPGKQETIILGDIA